MKIDFDKMDGLVPAVVQDDRSNAVLMVGFMNEAAFLKTEESGRVTFFSRSKNRLWTKGETSGNFLDVKSITVDCDNDTLLIKVIPTGPVCHTGAQNCFNTEPAGIKFLSELETIINDRKSADPTESYTARLFSEGINKIAQKVGEEATEVVIDAVNGNREGLKEETADLLYHLIVLLHKSELTLTDIAKTLQNRHRQ